MLRELLEGRGLLKKLDTLFVPSSLLREVRTQIKKEPRRMSKK